MGREGLEPSRVKYSTNFKFEASTNSATIPMLLEGIEPTFAALWEQSIRQIAKGAKKEGNIKIPF